MNKDVAAKMINGASIVSVAVIVKIPITDIKRDSFSTATEKSLGPGDGFRSTRETGLVSEKLSVIPGKQWRNWALSTYLFGR